MTQTLNASHIGQVLFAVLIAIAFSGSHFCNQADGQQIASNNDASPQRLSWESLPDLPNSIGVAGPFAGVHNDALIIAGGANFAPPVWDNEKQWLDDIHVLVKNGDQYEWKSGGKLPRPIAYGAAVSTDKGVLCIGGNDQSQAYADVFLLSWNPTSESISITEYPSLPNPVTSAAATLAGDKVFLAGGQRGLELSSATNDFLSLDLANDEEQFKWESIASGFNARAFNLTVSQHNGFNDCIYVMSGRAENVNAEKGVDFLQDVYEFSLVTQSWRRRSDAPRSFMAGQGFGFGQSHIFVTGGATGRNWGNADELKDDHPGFVKQSLLYNTITDAWTEAGSMPANHVTTIAVKWGEDIIIPSGEVRPRVRSAKIWKVRPESPARSFGIVNYIVLFAYLLAMVGVGLFFTRRNKTTDDFFRGGKRIPWWAAGCSIFATMLSSLTYTGIPSKSFAQDWVYSIGNFMIPVVAIIAVLVALPFFRRIDATSAYEYLEKRFNRKVRWFGSGSFVFFHCFRMAVVMSLTGLALAVATPLTPAQSVLLMGVLSIVYCTMGGIEAVIWTDTIQTFVLFGGALIAVFVLVGGIDGGFSGFTKVASDADKFSMANFHWDMTSTQIALWVIIVGSFAQNLSSYTADQAVVQRYMTTENEKLAARSIWTNAILTIPATFLFFGIGTALFVFYKSHPEKLDPTITTDQIFPLFIATELPIGLAGLIVAGIFAAAQSTVSTSMNSTATSIVTDFLRPLNACKSEAGFLRAARGFTVIMGVLGTLLALVFINPEIKSLFDQFIRIIGLFMGVLGGLFVLGATTKRANANGALIGALVGAATMFCLWKFSSVNGYLYTAVGITTCCIVGYLTSLIIPAQQTDLHGLTIHTLNTDTGEPDKKN